MFALRIACLVSRHQAAATALARLACLPRMTGLQDLGPVSASIDVENADDPGAPSLADDGTSCDPKLPKDWAIEARTTMQVLDALIAELRYQEINLTAGLTDSAKHCADPQSNSSNDTCKRLASVKAALKTAYEHRAGMAYIRPPGAYLRTSFP